MLYLGKNHELTFFSSVLPMILSFGFIFPKKVFCLVCIASISHEHENTFKFCHYFLASENEHPCIKVAVIPIPLI